MNRILITGGAGFIGLRLAAGLLAQGNKVVIFDNLCEQVHGLEPVAVPDGAEMVRGDVRSVSDLSNAMSRLRPDTVVHLAAETGTAQSAQRPSHYCEVNVIGTTNLLECLTRHGAKNCRVLLASTRAVYGEGAHRDAAGRVFNPPTRSESRLQAGMFEVLGDDGQELVGVPTMENLPACPISVYGSTKLMQEQLVRQLVPPERHVILRLQNVYGPGQSLRNAYTGVLTHFCRQALAGQDISVFEDGRITRDFVYIDDVVTAMLKACSLDGALGHIINVGSARPVTLLDAALEIARTAGLPERQVRVTGEYRSGDVRHARADITRAEEVLAWSPRTTLSDGLSAMIEWARINRDAG